MMGLGVMLMLRVLVVVVGGGAVLVSQFEVNPATVLAGSTSVWGNTTSPAFAGAGGGSVGVLQGLVFLVWIGVRSERPHLSDGFGHGEGLMWVKGRTTFWGEQSVYA